VTSRRWRRIGIVLGIVVVVAVFAFVLPRIADYGQVWGVVKGLTWTQVVVLVAATLLNLVTFAPPWMAALPGLGFARAFVVTQASTASTYIAPGGAAVGIALSYTMFHGWGLPTRSIALAAALTGVWNQLAVLGFPVVALALLTLQKEQNAALQTVAVIGLAVFVVAVAGFALALSAPQLARRFGDTAARFVNRILASVHRKPVGWTGESFVRFRHEAVGLLARRWHVLTLATLAGQLAVFVVLLVTLRTLGVSADEVSAVEAFAAWSLIRLLGSLPITPGGLGVVEVGLTAALVGFGGDNAEVVAAVLLYRFLTIVPTLVLGLVAGAAWRRLKEAHRE
jgi:uncharacterized protein (TIRG00374 family)